MVVPTAGQIRKPDLEKLDVSVLLDEPLPKEPVDVVVKVTPKPEEQWTRKELVVAATGFLCCNIIGLPALIMSIFSYVDFSQKNYQESLRKRKTAKRLGIAALLIGLLFLALFIAVLRFSPHRPERFALQRSGNNAFWNRIQFEKGVHQSYPSFVENGARFRDFGPGPNFGQRPAVEHGPRHEPKHVTVTESITELQRIEAIRRAWTAQRLRRHHAINHHERGDINRIESPPSWGHHEHGPHDDHGPHHEHRGTINI